MSDYIYFASDFHLGFGDAVQNRNREKVIVSWMSSIIDSCRELYLLGDVFDYWFEYREVIPRGHVRVLGKIAEFTDRGIPVHLFTGNHDMWMFGYLEEELGVRLYHRPVIRQFKTKKIMIGHGDGLGPGDHGYKLMKKVFRNRLNQWLFARLHPNFAIRLMKYTSRKSRESEMDLGEFLGPEKEWLVSYCEKKLEEEYIDYFIFGHRHLPIDYPLSNGKSRYINTGDWIQHNSYARFDGDKLELLNYVQ